MKKVLLSMAVLLMGSAVNAQNLGTRSWQKTIEAIEDDGMMIQAPVAVAPDGSVYATGTFNKSFTFAGTSLDPVATSAYVAKYSATGTEMWAQPLSGSATITCAATDAEGNVYVAGKYADEVTLGSADGNSRVIQGMKDGADYVTRQASMFLAKYDANGHLKAVRTIIPAIDATINGSGMYLDLGVMGFTPNHLQVAGGRVYVSALYSGDVRLDDMAWEGHYVNSPEIGMYMDNNAAGIFSVSAANLTGAKSEALLQTKEEVITNQLVPEDVYFIVDGGTLYTAFAGQGELTLVTPNNHTDFSFAHNEAGREHAFILAAIGASTTVKSFHGTADAAEAPVYTVDQMAVADGQLYVAGISAASNGFAPSQPSVGATNMYLARFDASTLNLRSALVDSYDEGDSKHSAEVLTGLNVVGGKTYVTGYVEKTDDHSVTSPLNWNVDTEFATADDALVTSMSTNGKLLATLGNSKTVSTVTAYDATTGIAALTADTVAKTGDNWYTVAGTKVARPTASGLYIHKGKKYILR